MSSVATQSQPLDNKNKGKTDSKDSKKTDSKIYTPKPECHRGNICVLSWERLRIYGGGDSHGARPEPGMVVLDLAGVADPPRLKVNGPMPLPRTRETQLPYTQVRLEWRDMSVPAVGRSFWVAFLTDVVEQAEKEPVDLLVMCQGGHGRTGTALAIMAGLFNAIPEGECPVAWVWQHYCNMAVETQGQCDYITEITGIPVHTDTRKLISASKSYAGTTGKYGVNGWSE